ncbi:splicing regulatory glutamine/lysine-rich protein 1 [Carica papaya]|uniref:splicing regulatory glutamine/lysine-rich protein 1 n=1 Tax=Carica papaya TaxID=3649 RepID=UPI000B8C91EB|nr:splicing regulatory glutamine/lysine-rich protein 1 [Carica papaya]
MSRCFPFPPPGYEKKARTDDVDLLKKEKHKEKKHKKEKKDREKKESKERREKDRGDGKHREKKDKKEKQRDKKKEKDREKDKDKNNKLEEKRIPMQFEGYNGDKVSDEKRLPGKHEGHTVEKFIQKEKERDKDRSGMSGEKKYTGQFSGYNGERVSQNNHLAEESKDYRFVQELEKRVRDEGAGSQLVDNFTITDRTRNEGMVKLVPKTAGTSIGAKEKTKDKTVDDRKLEGQGIRDEARVIGNSVVQNLVGIAQPKVEGIARKLEKDFQKMVEGKEKIHPFPENGRLLELSQASSLSTSDRPGSASNKVDSKERKVNGMIEGQPLTVSSLKPPLATSTARAEGQSLSVSSLKPHAMVTPKTVQNAEVPKKPPHPDLKYLNEILTVPKMEEWSDFDDQEWLFRKSELQPRRQRMEYSEVDETPKVWAESMQIDSVDIVALPYVIPY